jgi:TPR repeat protein
MYRFGHGVDEDFGKGIVLIAEAANRGLAEAQYEVGMIRLDKGQKLYNPSIATHWLSEAAKENYAPAIGQLGNCYEHGLGIEQDYKKAAECYTIAAKAGIIGAAFALGTLYENGLGVEQDYREAGKWYEPAANSGYPSAIYNLGRFFQFGWGVTPDFAKAFELYHAAAERGHAMCQLLVGQALLIGQEGTPVDETAGFAWMLRAAEQGVVEAQDEVGFRFLAGRGVAADAERAEYWNRQAAAQGHPRAQCMLAYSLIRAETADRNSLVEAAKWLILAFNQPEKLDEQLSGFINQEWQNVCSRLSEADINEAQQQADAVLAGE